MGFWNSVIYLIVSRIAVQEVFTKHVRHHAGSSSASQGRLALASTPSLAPVHPPREQYLGVREWSDSVQGLAGKDARNGGKV